MNPESQAQFYNMLSRQAELNSVQYTQGVPGLNFTVTPSVEQKLEQQIQESSDFLSKINIEGVTDIAGDTIGLGSGSSIASTTNTEVDDRETSDPTVMDDKGYSCHKTNFDTHLTYNKMDLWAGKPNFQKIWRNVVVEQQARDRMCIGFNGTSRAAKSNRVTNPLLEDVNIGWLQKIRDYKNGANHLSDIVLGGDNEYKNDHALVLAIVNELISPWYRQDTGLVVICGRNIIADKYVGLVNDNVNKPASEQIAIKTLLATKQLGNLPTIQVPFFPENSIMVTKLDQLSVYYQRGSRRRSIVDNAKRDRVEDYQSVNEDYVIEDGGCAALIENISWAEE